MFSINPLYDQSLRAEFSGSYVVQKRTGEGDRGIWTLDQRMDFTSAACVSVAADPGLTKDDGCLMDWTKLPCGGTNRRLGVLTELSPLTEARCVDFRAPLRMY